MNQVWMIHAALISGEGKTRNHNEDAYYFDGDYPDMAEGSGRAALCRDVPADGSMWAVCDGIGGRSNGELASHTAVSGMPDLQQHLEGRDFAATLRNWVLQANQAVLQRAEGGGTTLAMAYFRDGCVYLAHLGDTRIYCFRSGQLVRMTRDHSKVELLLRAGMITEEEVRTHPQRHIITRYLGMDGESVCDAEVQEKIPVRDLDRYILCSDGIHDMIPDDGIGRIASAGGNAEACAKSLYEAAMEAGGRDNLTVLVLDVDGEILPPCEEEDEPTLRED